MSDIANTPVVDPHAALLQELNKLIAHNPTMNRPYYGLHTAFRGLCQFVAGLDPVSDYVLISALLDMVTIETPLVHHMLAVAIALYGSNHHTDERKSFPYPVFLQLAGSKEDAFRLFCPDVLLDFIQVWFANLPHTAFFLKLLNEIIKCTTKYSNSVQFFSCGTGHPQETETTEYKRAKSRFTDNVHVAIGIFDQLAQEDAKVQASDDASDEDKRESCENFVKGVERLNNIDSLCWFIVAHGIYETAAGRRLVPRLCR